MMPPPPRLHWMPVNPSWLVAAGICVGAALPQNIPAAFRRFIVHPIGAVALFIVAGWLMSGPSPVLAVSLLLLFGSVSLIRTEPFQAVILNKDKIADKGQRWLSEEILHEEPEGIQERTEEPQLLLNRVTPDEQHPWESETTLNEHTSAIQERPISAPIEYDESNNSLHH